MKYLILIAFNSNNIIVVLPLVEQCDFITITTLVLLTVGNIAIYWRLIGRMTFHAHRECRIIANAELHVLIYYTIDFVQYFIIILAAKLYCSTINPLKLDKKRNDIVLQEA